MEIIIKGDPKEIAALVVAAQGRQFGKSLIKASVIERTREIVKGTAPNGSKTDEIHHKNSSST